jgi:bacteriocin biosynthesis cyclodehydratase domain-containing protein
MQSSDARYRLRPSFSVIPHSPNVVELRRGVWNPISITLTDRTEAGKLARALELMTGELSMGEIVAQAGLSDAEDKELVSFLSRHNVIETKPGSAFDTILDVVRGTLVGGESRLGADKIVFIGDAEVTVDIMRQLDSFGHGLRYDVVDEATTARLSGQDLTVSEDPLALREELRAYDDWKNGLLVVAALTIHPILFRNINRVCGHHAIPWLHAAADGPLLLVGPTFIPRRTSCYECFETRILLNMRESESYIRYKRALTTQAVRLGRSPLGLPFRSLLASLTAIEVGNLLATGSSFTVGKTLSVHLPSMGFSFNEVLRSPGCAACSPITEQHEQSLYFDLSGLVSRLAVPEGAAAV